MNICHASLRLVCLVACIGLACGCGGNGQKVATAPGARGDEKTAGQALRESMHRGIEVHRLLDRPYRHKLEAILSKYSAEPLGLSEQQIEMWRSEGLRVVAVPADEESLKKLVVALTGEMVVERVHMGVVPEWRAVATAPKIEGSKLVRVGGEVAPFASGRFRLLLRAYPLIDSLTPVMRTELIVQFHQPQRDPFAPDAVREERMGVYVPTSALSMDLDGKWAVLVTAENPERTWGGEEPGPKAPEQAAAQAAEPPEDAAVDPEKVDAGDAGHGEDEAGRGAPPAPGEVVGPESPRIRTTGEEALISPDGNTRFVLIFVPRVK